MNPNKRRDNSPASNLAKRPRRPCTYGDNCYRRNPAHLREFTHPHLESILDNYSGTGEYPIPENLQIQKQMIEEQLQIIVEKNIYTPCKSDSTADVASAKENSAEQTVTSTNNISENGGTSNNIAASLSSVATPYEDTKKSQNRDASTSNVAAKDTKDSKSTDAGLSNVAAFKSSPKEDTENKKATNIAYVKPMQRNETVTLTLKNPQPVSRNNQPTMSSSSASSTANSDYRPIVNPTRRVEDFFKVVLPKGNMAEKHRRASPYYIFYTTITDAKETHQQPNSITFQELLDRSLGELKCSLQINFMVDPGWLLAHYYFAGYSQKKLTILYGEDMPELRTISQKQKHIEAHMVNMGTPFGKHHTKVMLLCYEDGSMRVVVSTANLYTEDWENRVQGLWLSPRCPELPDSAMPHEGESETGFKKSLLSYLDHYRLPCLTHYIERVRRCDFSFINVFLVASVPGGHTDTNWGMSRVGDLLRKHCKVPKQERSNWELIAQSSSIGSYGKEPRLWLTGDFQTKFCQVQSEPGVLPSSPPRLRIIYPSLENVRQSHDNLLGGGCLPYSASSHTKQPWLNDFLHQWKAKGSGRDKAMPHIKSYLRVSPDYKKAAFYLLTSGNISKAAWGTLTKGTGALRIMSYEAGVLFLPRFVINREYFLLDKTEDDCLPLTYDLPPIPYTSSMSPWVSEYLRD